MLAVGLAEEFWLAVVLPRAERRRPNRIHQLRLRPVSGTRARFPVNQGSSFTSAAQTVVEPSASRDGVTGDRGGSAVGVGQRCRH